MHRLYLALAASLALPLGLGACGSGTLATVSPVDTGDTDEPGETCADYAPDSLPPVIDGQAQAFQGWDFQDRMRAERSDLTREACLACADGDCMQPEDWGNDDQLYLGSWTDAAAGEWCDIYGTPACGPVWDDGRCVFVMDAWWSCAVDGRPLLVDGAPCTAQPVDQAWVPACTGLQPVPAELREAVRQRWIRAGLMEHASVAAFARFSLQLTALGAPPELLAESAAAAADEVQHAKRCFAIASALGPPVGPGPLPAQALADLPVDPRTVLQTTFLEGCVGETVAAALARAGAESARDPQIARVLHGIAQDETRHAALAWRTVQWMLREHPELRHDLLDLARGVQLTPSTDAHLPAHGQLGGAQADRVGSEIIEQVVRPLVAGLIQHPSTDEDAAREPARA